ncbi:GGDEF domain-containing protein [Thioclava sp. BHET1]|nr:GGDEF domain-containing protein [Thioclava sp. BHET1]
MNGAPEIAPSEGLASRDALRKVIARTATRAQEFEQLVPILGALLPMFLWVDPQGKICALGATLQKAMGGRSVLGQPFERFFRIGRSRDRLERCQDAGTPLCAAQNQSQSCDRRMGRCGASLMRLAQQRIVHLTLVEAPGIGLRGEAFSVGQAGEAGILLSLSFGIHLREAVAEFALTDGDFSPADLAIDLLYQQEAKALVTGELRALTARLDKARKAAEAQALSDPLTGLANRRAMDAALDQALAGAARGGAGFTLVQIDLDHFKQVNDSLGHATGDYVLGVVSEILRDSLRVGDLAARMGGDEFVLLMRGTMTPEQIAELGARLIGRLSEPIRFEGGESRISGSLGVVRSIDYAAPAKARILWDADVATYAAKAAGRGQCILHQPSEQEPRSVPKAG